MPTDNGLVFLFDVDNTLLDNDHITADLKQHLQEQVGPERQQRYWDIFEQLRTELGYADYLGALQRYRIEYPRDPGLLTVSRFLIDYPFATRLYPDSLDVVEHVKQWGQAVSGIYETFDGNVLIYIHKEQELDDVERRFPAEHYVVIDDKLRILAAIKKIWGVKVTTVFPKQGHYAHDPQVLANFPAADISVDRIGDLLDCAAEVFLPRPGQ